MNFLRKPRYNKFSDYAKALVGEKIWRVPINIGATCPNRDGRLARGGCLYCGEEGSFYNPTRLTSPRETNLSEQIENGIKAIGEKKNAKKFIAYFQPYSGTYISPDVLKESMETAASYPSFEGFSVSTRPDCVPNEVLDVLKNYKKRFKILWLELGLQSADFGTLKNLNRAHGVSHFVDAVLRAHERGIAVCAHIILGLPGENAEHAVETARLITALRCEGVKAHSLYIIRGTQLEKDFKNGKISLIAMDEYVRRAVLFLEHIPENIVVHRITGECRREWLVAPDWCSEKHRVRKAIEDKMTEQNTYQGAKARLGLSVEELRCL